MTIEAVTFGEALALFVAQEAGDLAAVESYKRVLAGAEVNVAIGLTRLGHRENHENKKLCTFGDLRLRGRFHGIRTSRSSARNRRHQGRQHQTAERIAFRGHFGLQKRTQGLYRTVAY